MRDEPSHSEPVYFDEKDRPLRREVGRLGALLGELLTELAPAGVFETVESARLIARRRRKGDARAGKELEELLGALGAEAALEVVRAFSAYFGVVNMAEQAHRMRRRIDYLREERVQPGSLRASAEELVRRGVSAEEVEAALSILTVEPVFTAHPTEAVRRTILKKDQRLAMDLVTRFDASRMDPIALGKLDESIALEIASAWQTEEASPGAPRWQRRSSTSSSSSRTSCTESCPRCTKTSSARSSRPTAESSASSAR